MHTITYKPIGIINSPFKDKTGIPRQAVGASDIKATIKIHEEYTEGLEDLDGFSHIVVLFHLHMVA